MHDVHAETEHCGGLLSWHLQDDTECSGFLRKLLGSVYLASAGKSLEKLMCRKSWKTLDELGRDLNLQLLLPSLNVLTNRYTDSNPQHDFD